MLSNSSFKEQFFNRESRYFLPTLFVCMLVVFTLNSNFTIQRDTIENVYIPSAESLIQHGVYTYPQFEGKPATYPMWGYSIISIVDVLIGSKSTVIVIIQFLLCFLSVVLCYRLIPLNPRTWHCLLWIPHIAFCRVVFPDVIVMFLLLIGIYLLQKNLPTQESVPKENNLKHIPKSFMIWIISLGITFGALNQFRSDYVLFAPLLLVVIAYRYRNQLYSAFSFVVIPLIIIFTCSIPWMYYTWQVTGSPKLSSTNGGAVAYITLGQLPHNGWGITYSDSTAMDVAFEKTGSWNPYTSESNTALTQEFVSMIGQMPFSYAKKVSLNMIKAISGGTYSGELSEYVQATPVVSSTSIFKRATTIPSLLTTHPVQALLTVLDVLFRLISIIIILTGCYLFAIRYFIVKTLTPSMQSLWLCTSVLIAYKILICGLLQYEARHMSPVYPFVLILLLAVFSRNNKSDIV